MGLFVRSTTTLVKPNLAATNLIKLVCWSTLSTRDWRLLLPSNRPFLAIAFLAWTKIANRKTVCFCWQSKESFSLHSLVPIPPFLLTKWPQKGWSGIFRPIPAILNNSGQSDRWLVTCLPKSCSNPAGCRWPKHRNWEAVGHSLNTPLLRNLIPVDKYP